MIVSVHQPHYLPWLGYFDKMDRCDIFVILDNVQYKKREFQNRNKIKTPEGELWLTVPVLTHGRYEQTTGQVRIDNTVNWQAKHLKAMEMNYRKAPHFDACFTALEKLYAQRQELLIGLNMAMLHTFLDLLGMRRDNIRLESALNVEGAKTQRLVNICKALGAGTYLSGAGGKAYMETGLFEQNGLRLEYHHFDHPEYPQLHGGFLPYLAIADLLFNCGRASLDILRGGRIAS